MIERPVVVRPSAAARLLFGAVGVLAICGGVVGLVLLVQAGEWQGGQIIVAVVLAFLILAGALTPLVQTRYLLAYDPAAATVSLNYFGREQSIPLTEGTKIRIKAGGGDEGGAPLSMRMKVVISRGLTDRITFHPGINGPYAEFCSIIQDIVARFPDVDVDEFTREMAARG